MLGIVKCVEYSKVRFGRPVLARTKTYIPCAISNRPVNVLKEFHVIPRAYCGLLDSGG